MESRGAPRQLRLSVLYARMPLMKAAMNLLCVLLSILGSVALVHVVGVVNPREKVNGPWLVVAAKTPIVSAI